MANFNLIINLKDTVILVVYPVLKFYVYKFQQSIFNVNELILENLNTSTFFTRKVIKAYIFQGFKEKYWGNA
jgi:hypothetical protein